MIKARYSRSLPGNKAECLLCPHQCIIPDGATGICRVRHNKGGIIYSLTYGKISALHSDPIEKKPLYHFFPGSQILSAGSVGCNFRCSFCQNCEISQSALSEYPYIKNLTPAGLAELASVTPSNLGLAYTYNEPIVNYEFVIETARHITEKGLKNVMVTNGYINEEPLHELLRYTDAWNVDLKGFSDDFYREYTGGKLTPVLHTLKTIREENKHLEITTLIIPGLNDDERTFNDMTVWIASELGKETVLHLSRYFPRYKMNIASTPLKTLENLQSIALQKLRHVYLGNI